MGGPSGVIMAGKSSAVLWPWLPEGRHCCFQTGDNDGPSHHLEDMSICEPVLHRDCTQTVDPQTLGQLGGQGSWTFPAVDGNSAAFHEGWGVLSSVVLTDLSQVYYVCDWRPRRIVHRLDVNNQRNTLTGGVIHCEDFISASHTQSPPLDSHHFIREISCWDVP